MHHENLLGTGYPDHLEAAQISTEARLISVADIFQALSQERPYRTRLAREEVMAQLDDMLALGRLDRRMVDLVRSHLEQCYSLAVD
jgi:HD-GYP domain-containing protein (c-di-GMP phosphodiesterase class II)